jgi:hypothetical protein
MGVTIAIFSSQAGAKSLFRPVEMPAVKLEHRRYGSGQPIVRDSVFLAGSKKMTCRLIKNLRNEPE